MKFKILGAGAILLLMPVIVLAAYNSVSLTTGTTLRTTVSGSTIDLTVTNGTVESVTVNSGTIDIVLAGGSSIDFTSADRKVLSYTSGNRIAVFTCGSSSSVLNLSLASSYSSETVTVIPSTATCVDQSVTSGGSGSSESSSSSSSSTTSTTSTSDTSTTSSSSAPSTTTTTTTTTVEPSTTTAAPVSTTVSVPVVVSTPVPVLTSEINPGARSDDVTTLQTLLAKDPTIYPAGTISGYYGPLTTAAVKNFQAKYGLPTVGRVGPATLAKINEVYGTTQPSSVQAQTSSQIQTQIESIQQQIQALTGTSVSATFSTGLGIGGTGASVKQLQQVLNSDPDTRVAESGVGSPGNETTLFGALTEKAVQRFQVKYGIAGPGDSGYGYVGPKTRAKLNELSGGASSQAIPETPLSTASQPSATASMIDQITAQIQAIQDQIKALQGQ